MKKLILFVTFLIFTTAILISCSKKDQPGPVINPTPPSTETPLSATLFDELNETIARFDPLYLQIVYKDKRSKAEIIKEATRLVIAINQNPTSLVIQNALTDLYHFKNFADLQIASNTISKNSNELKKRILDNDNVLSVAKLNQLNEARNNFLKNKISTLAKATQRTSSGLWQDNAAWILDQFHYYSQVGNLEMGFDLDGATAGNECNESCCFEYKACQTNAVTNYRQHIVFWTVGGILSGTSAGFAAGTIIPLVGNFYGAAYGGWLAGTAGYVLAINTYMNDLNICVLNYKACILKKNGN